MWLLHTKTLELRHFTKPEDSNTRYAILSHVWEDADHAQSFQDIRAIHARCVSSGADPRPLVTEKVRRFCVLAEEAGYEWVWLDTACIDKTSSAELSEAINSMWAWYRDAEVCYAYLCDVGDDDDPRAPDSEFRRSKWYTRGWTLQELLAPRHVVFLSHGWTVIGTKVSLLAAVAEITGIDDCFLAQGRQAELWKASVAKRMSWASRRRTSRIEDRAYSLLGVFGVSMPIIYGEGLSSFTRLQIEILRYTRDHSIFAWGAIHPNFDVVHADIEWPDKKALSRYSRTRRNEDRIPSSWDALLASSPSDFELSGDIIPVHETQYIHDFDCRPEWNPTFTSNGVLLTLPLSTDYAPSTHRTSQLVYAAALCCSRELARTGYIVLFLIIKPSDMGSVARCRHVGTLSTQSGHANFYRGAVLAPPSETSSRDFVIRELSIGASMTHEALHWKRPKILPSTGYHFSIPQWVVRRLESRYGFHIHWSGPVQHDGYHITEAPGSSLHLDSNLPRSSSTPVFDVRFYNHRLKETLVIDFGVGCQCPQAQQHFILQPQHWWINIHIARGCGEPSSDIISRQTEQFVPQGPNEVSSMTPLKLRHRIWLRDTGCTKRHLATDPLLPHTRQYITFTHLPSHRTVHVQSVLSFTDGEYGYSFNFAPSPIIIMLDLEGFDVDLVHSPTRTDRSPLPALPQAPGHAGVAESPSNEATDCAALPGRDFSSAPSWAALAAVSQSTLRNGWRSITDWIGAEVDCTYGSLV